RTRSAPWPIGTWSRSSAAFLEATFGGVALAASFLDQPLGRPAASGCFSTQFVAFVMADHRLDVLGIQCAATPRAAQRAPVGDTLWAAAASRMPHAVRGQWLSIALDRAGQAPAQKALQFGEVRGPTGGLTLALPLGVCHCVATSA